MTRAERAAQREQKLKEELATARRDRIALEAQAQARERIQQRQALHKRRYRVGLLAEQAGLLTWDDATLSTLFALLATLGPLPNPEAVLESLLRDPEDLASLRPGGASVLR